MVINDSQPVYCVERAMHILNRHRKSINGARILMLGISYKNDIDDLPHGNSHLIAETAYLVDQTDVHIAVCILKYLLHLRHCCVPTPLDIHQEPDISYVRDSAERIATYLKPGTMVVLESTTWA